MPCVIFIDEVESFFRARSNDDHNALASVKSEFLSMWDGMLSTDGVMIIGATNRPEDVDVAFLRRMPRQFEIGLPDETNRADILRIIIKSSSDEVNSDVDLVHIAKETENFSGSDLRELCRTAAEIRIKEYIANDRATMMTEADNGESVGDVKLRPISNDDFNVALSRVSATIMKHKSPKIGSKGGMNESFAPRDFMMLLHGLTQLMASNNSDSEGRAPYRPKDTSS